MLVGAFAGPITTSNPEGKSDADAYLYYTAYGNWPAWYTRYHGLGGYHYLGKRRAVAPATGGVKMAHKFRHGTVVFPVETLEQGI